MFAERIEGLARWGPVYWHPLLYRAAMRSLRRRHHPAMYRLVAEEIGGLSTLDLCCGEGGLARWLGRDDYRGIDRNPGFVASLERRGIKALQGDILAVDWPEADCLVMVDSLYHFLPGIDRFLEKALAFPFKRFIISEPIVNIASDRRPWLAGLAAWATRVDGRDHPQRFTAETLGGLFRRYRFQKVRRTEFNLIGVMER